jgi:L,D-transpeptidase YcbB
MRKLLQSIVFFGAVAQIQGAAGWSAGGKDDFLPPAVAQPTPEIDAPGLDAISPSNGKTPDEQQAGTALPPEETLPRVPEERGQPEGVPGATTTQGAVLPPTNGENEGVAPSEPLPAVNAALKFALEARLGLPDPLGLHRREREAISAYYMARGFAPLWWNAGAPTAEAKAVVERLKRASDDGLDLKGFAPDFSPSSDREVAAADIALTDAVVAYGRQASGSRVDPHMISRLIGAEPEVADPALILALVSRAGASAGDELRKFNPPQKGYLALREKLAEVRRGHGIARARTSVEGRSEAQQEAAKREEHTYPAAGGLQTSNGLKASGKFAARAAAVAGETARLEAEIIANMEIWRWMPRDLGERRVEVNIPDFEAAVIDHGEVVERTRVIVGKEQTPTPVFSETMRFLIVNPYWNVPPSIMRKEMLPKAAGDPSYFRRLGYEVFTRAGHLVVRQPPGERNALGRIKFMFPNDFSVYMHDTPMRRLFAAQKRAFSHGCVRVDEPFRFAETVLGRANGWSEERVKKLIGGKERYVYLPKPLPVHIEYFTAYVDESGALRLRSDLYGYSRKVRQALGLEGKNS